MNKNVVAVLVGLIAMAFGMVLYYQQQADFTTLKGDKYRWKDLQGQYVLVNYFAEWCAPCLKEIPELNAFHEFASSQGNIKLFAVSYDPLTNEELMALKLKYKMDFPLLNASEAKMLNPHPNQLPATFIISPEGKVLKKLLGEQTSESLKSIIELLQGS